MFSYILYSIKRRKIANLIIVGISVMLVILLNLYFGNIRSYETQLEELAWNVPVYCQVTNINGTRASGLFISENMVDGLKQSDRIKDESCMVFLMAGEGDFRPEEFNKYLNLYVSGANKAEAVDGLTDKQIHMDKERIDDFFSSDRRECIVSEGAMKKYQWEVGKEIGLNFYYYSSNSDVSKLDLSPMGLEQIKIVGTMEDLSGTTNAIPSDIILPFETVRGIYRQYNIPFFADTVTFCVRDPLRLNEFKAEMKSIGFMEKEPEAKDSYMGDALAVKDSSFISMATELRHSIDLMQSFLPIVCMMVLAIGYIVSYLSGNSRMGEYLLLRLQGVKRIKGSVLFLVEQMMMVLVGNILGDSIMVLFSPGLPVMALVNAVVLGAYLIGAAMAYWRMGAGSVMRLLSVRQS